MVLLLLVLLSYCSCCLLLIGVGVRLTLVRWPLDDIIDHHGEKHVLQNKCNKVLGRDVEGDQVRCVVHSLQTLQASNLLAIHCGKVRNDEAPEVLFVVIGLFSVIFYFLLFVVCCFCCCFFFLVY